jgi:hypothetical protein
MSWVLWRSVGPNNLASSIGCPLMEASLVYRNG